MIFVDAHVHIHECYDIDTFFRAMARNIETAARQQNAAEYHAVACLTEVSGLCMFNKLETTLEDASWIISGTDESESLNLSHPEHGRICVIAGRQIATSERLEVLALGTLDCLPDGREIGRTLQDCIGIDAIPVLPWGFGKWTGRRGRIIEHLLETASPDAVYIGDNASRFRYFPEPRAFRRARERGYKMLPGTDPFPFPREADRAGRYGFVIREPLDTARPLKQLKRHLTDPERTGFQSYGRTEDNPIRFLRNQVAMQLR